MYTWLFRLAVVLICPAIVYFGKISPNAVGIGIGVGVGLLIVAVEYLVAEMNLLMIVAGVLGAAGGLILARVLGFIVSSIGNKAMMDNWEKFTLLTFFALGVLGMVIAIRKFPELDDLDKDILKMGKKRGSELKILDCNAIIDGRVAEIVETHFLSGTIVVPRFVLTELHRLADAEDPRPGLFWRSFPRDDIRRHSCSPGRPPVRRRPRLRVRPRRRRGNRAHRRDRRPSR